MDKHKHVVRNLVAFAFGELDDPEMTRIESHLQSCSRCLKEYMEIKTVLSGISRLPEEVNAAMDEIDWEMSALAVKRALVFRGRRAQRWVWSQRGWKVWSPVLASIFVLGLAVGYLLFHSGSGRAINEGTDTPSPHNLAMIQRTLAKQEILAYLKQTQLLLTDMMGRCEQDATHSLFENSTSDRIRLLLLRGKLFREDLSEPRLITSQYLLKKIEWLLYELLALEEGATCGQVERLQKVVRDERLFFKIRLVEKELNSYEV